MTVIFDLAFVGRLSRGGDLLSFASPKESKQRKGDPTTRVPSLRYGQPAVLAPTGPAANSAATQPQTARLTFPSGAVRLGTVRRGRANACALHGAES